MSETIVEGETFCSLARPNTFRPLRSTPSAEHPIALLEVHEIGFGNDPGERRSIPPHLDASAPPCRTGEQRGEVSTRDGDRYGGIFHVVQDSFRVPARQ
jgi:hypothetical protein